jgi:hypothetical protein
MPCPYQFDTKVKNDAESAGLTAAATKPLDAGGVAR